MVDKGYFAANANADDWTDAGDKVARGEAAMTLMGTWIGGYWNGIGLKPGEDYDFFEFPQIDGRRAECGGRPRRRPRDLGQRRQSGGGGEIPELHDLRHRRAVQVGQEPRRASANVNVDPSIYSPVMQHAAEGRRRRGRLRLQLRPVDAAPGGRSRPFDVLALHG